MATDQTIAEKIFSNHCGKTVRAGDHVVASVDLAMATDGSGPLAIELFNQMDPECIWDPQKILMVLDHYVPCPNDKVSGLHDMIRNFHNSGRCELFDLGEGICHQLLPEKGYVKPGNIVVGADSHTCSYGAFNALGTGIGSSDLAAVMADGKLWFKIPSSIKIRLNGQMAEGVSAKDIALFIVGKLGASGANYRSIEFHGSGVEKLDMNDRMTLCNMMTETGAKCSLMPFDKVTQSWTESFRWTALHAINTDAGALFDKVLEINIDEICPQIAAPHQVDNVSAVSKTEGTPIHMVVIGTCTNGRLKDLAAAARILKDYPKASGVEILIVPASRNVYAAAIKKGYIDIFIRAGAIVLPPGCGPCCGSSAGIPSDGENVLSTANRNFLGRMGNVHANIYLGSPESAACAAVEGKITDPRRFG